MCKFQSNTFIPKPTTFTLGTHSQKTGFCLSSLPIFPSSIICHIFVNSTFLCILNPLCHLISTMTALVKARIMSHLQIVSSPTEIAPSLESCASYHSQRNLHNLHLTTLLSALKPFNGFL